MMDASWARFRADLSRPLPVGSTSELLSHLLSYQITYFLCILFYFPDNSSSQRRDFGNCQLRTLQPIRICELKVCVGACPTGPKATVDCQCFGPFGACSCVPGEAVLETTA
ncbi:unnamed protein product [Protopolystoma xenopodis]|uniref:Uncharacterized protein n=1 Tax=Protopolystoma xenopodis TaxID=117903 RepID=A0A3S5B5I8_9PLAT|nr:unnamed protein product [Protopolystoma xenopodis]